MLEHDRTQTAIPVLFAVPFDARGTDDKNQWIVEVTAASDGKPFKALFEVPVFRTNESSRDFQLDESSIEPYAGNSDAADVVKHSFLRLSQNEVGRTTIVAPMFRAPGLAMVMGTISLIFSGVTIALFASGHWFIGSVFGFFACILCWSFVDTAFYKSVLDDRGSTFRFRGGLFGIGRLVEIAKSEIQNVDTDMNAKAGNVVIYDVRLKLENKKKVRVIRYLKGNALADAVKDEVERLVLESTESLSYRDSSNTQMRFGLDYLVDFQTQ